MSIYRYVIICQLHFDSVTMTVSLKKKIKKEASVCGYPTRSLCSNKKQSASTPPMQNEWGKFF